jgi:hypothetical protein
MWTYNHIDYTPLKLLNRRLSSLEFGMAFASSASIHAVRLTEPRSDQAEFQYNQNRGNSDSLPPLTS